MRNLGSGGRLAGGPSWQARYALEHLDPKNVVGFEQAGTTGRVQIVTSGGGRIAFLEAKVINWFSLEAKRITGQVAEQTARQVLGHSEGLDVFSKVVIEAEGAIPQWFVSAPELEGIAVEVVSR